MKVLVLKNAEEIARTGARLVADMIRNLADHFDSVVLGLAGGRSLAGIYRALTEYGMSTWNKVHFFWVDERRVAITDPQSNYRLAEELLLGPLLKKGLIFAENIHPFQIDAAPELVTQNYLQELNRFGGHFDLVLLGAGEDGHIAGVFPDLVYPETAEFFFLDHSPKAPARRFTATPALLANTPSSFLIYSGSTKKAALRHFIDESTEKHIAERTLLGIADLNILTDQKV